MTSRNKEIICKHETPSPPTSRSRQHLLQHGGGGEVDIILDVCQAPKFTLQRVEDIRGGFLLVLYDSGALTSGIKTSVAASLMSKTVGRVPISISAMGGGG